jgi:UDP-N-acetylglucosamine 1-carboxyvinyltransferase
MDYYVVEGGHTLNGEVRVSGSKNAALPIITACLLIKGEVILENVPNLMDIRTIIQLVESLGAQVAYDKAKKILSVNTQKITNIEAPYDLVKTMRASTYVMGPLLSRVGESKVSMPGGCAIGPRPVDIHLAGFEALGAEINLEHGVIHAKAPVAKGKGPGKRKLVGNTFQFRIVSVGATANILMGSVLAQGTTILENCAMEPEIPALADFLNQAGAKISGAGTKKIVIEGVQKLHPVKYRIIPDRIETGTLLLAGAITRGNITVRNTDPVMVEALLSQLARIGFKIEKGKNSIHIKNSDNLVGIDVKTKVYPGFPTDLQAPLMSLMTTLPSISVINENIFENRYTHIGELLRMGADIIVENGIAIVRGGKKLAGAQVMMTDLRAGAALVLAGLWAEGITEIRRIYHTDRGYEELDTKLKSLGAKIERKKGGTA